MRILLAYEGSSFADAALAELIRGNKGNEAEVLVLNVVEPVLSSVPPQMAPGYAPELEEDKARARRIVDEAAERLRLAGYRAEGCVKLGEVRSSILEAATAWEADLIVLGSHGYGQIKRLLLGSVAQYIASHAACSVEIVRGKAA